MSTKQMDDLRELAEAGDIQAQNDLAASFATGDGVETDLALAAHWYRQAAIQQSPNATFNLGLMYLFGEGVVQDTHEALQLFDQACQLGSPAAHMVLGEAYELGKLGFRIDYISATEHYLKACRFGATEGIRSAGKLLQQGKISTEALSALMVGFEPFE